MRTLPAWWLPPGVPGRVSPAAAELPPHTRGAEPPGAASPAFSTAPVSDDLRLRFPTPDPAFASRLCDHLVEAGARLHERRTDSLVASLGRAGARFLDPADPIRQAALDLLPAAAGLSTAMAREVLDGMARDWTADRLAQLVRAQFPDPAVLDGFRPGPGGSRVRAFGHGLIVQVGAGNVAGVSVGGMARALLARSPVLLKPGLHDAVLPVLYARALADCDPGLAASLAVLYWPGGADTMEAEVLPRAGLVVVYGGADTVAAVRARLPATTPLVAYSHRVGVALVGREALATGRADRTAMDAARAVAAFDQRGCVSPHLFWVEEGGALTPAEWAARLAAAMAALEQDLPAGPTPPEVASRVQQLRGTWELKQAAGAGTRVFRPAGAEWTVAYDPDPAFSPSCLGRFAWVKPVPELERVAGLLAGLRPFLQTAGLCGAGARAASLVEQLGAAGVTRVASLRRMAWPPAWWHHDGGDPLRALVRWVDWEVEQEPRASG
ncbi:MAG: hypothetical protein OXU32_11365 [Gammaproteobacteria bacterium]|nr:hypothetical protein [Gammaproteobacteria bacterium]